MIKDLTKPQKGNRNFTNKQLKSFLNSEDEKYFQGKF
jgi:hypothetical protein